jgi:hypothetical protein
VSATLVACSLSCASDQDYLIIENAIWASDGCGLTASSASVASMTVDVAFPGMIGIGLTVTNNLTEYDFSNTGIDDTEIVLETAEVSLSFSGGGISANTIEVAIPTESISGGDSAAILVRVPSDVAMSLAETMANLPENTIETLEMEVVITGHRSQSGDRKVGAIRSRVFTFPFDVCYGCLATCTCPDGTTQICPTADDWTGTCGFAQGTITAASCPAA